MSESEGEDDPSSHVELAQPVRSRGNMVNARSAVRLIELGPRLTLKVGSSYDAECPHIAA